MVIRLNGCLMTELKKLDNQRYEQEKARVSGEFVFKLEIFLKDYKPYRRNGRRYCEEKKGKRDAGIQD